jgi:hypothetical protein
VGAADFHESCRLRRQANNSSNSNSNSNNDELLEEYEYPIKLGIKNGYQQLVMRSSGRYELELYSCWRRKCLQRRITAEKVFAELVDNDKVL